MKEKKNFLSRLFGEKKAGGCCSMEIVEEEGCCCCESGIDTETKEEKEEIALKDADRQEEVYLRD